MKLIPFRLSFWLRKRYVKLFRPILSYLHRPLSEFRYNVYSQNGEDGIIEELFRRIGVCDGWVVEFGAWDGIRLSNTYYLLHRNAGFRAIYIEGDTGRYEQLKCTAGRSGDRITPIHALVEPEGENSLQTLLNVAGIPEDFELLSIDVDGNDYQIWEHLARYRPKVVIIEINSSLPPFEEQINGADAQGSSFFSMLNLGRRKGYSCVCHVGNMVFIRDDLLSKVRMKEEHLVNPELLFRRDWLIRDVTHQR